MSMFPRRSGPAVRVPLLGRRAACHALGGLALGALGCKRRDGAGARPAPERAHRHTIERLDFGDATTLFSASADAMCVWDARHREAISRTPLESWTGSLVGRNAADVDFASKRFAWGERGRVHVKTLPGAASSSATAAFDGELVGLGPRGETVVLTRGPEVLVVRVADGATLFARGGLWPASVRARDRARFAFRDRSADKTTIVDAGSGAVVSAIDALGAHPIFSEDGKELLSVRNGALCVHDVATGEERLRIPQPMESSDGRGQQPKPDDVRPIALARGTIVGTHTPNELVTFDAHTGRRKAFFPAPTGIGVPGIAVTPDASIAIAISTDKLYRFDLDRSNLLSPHDITPPVPLAQRPAIGAALPLMRGAEHVAVAPDGRWVAFAGLQGLWVLDATSLRNEAVRLDPA